MSHESMAKFADSSQVEVLALISTQLQREVGISIAGDHSFILR